MKSDRPDGHLLIIYMLPTGVLTGWRGGIPGGARSKRSCGFPEIAPRMPRRPCVPDGAAAQLDLSALRAKMTE